MAQIITILVGDEVNGWFEIANVDGDLTSTVEVNTCKTRKSRDKQERQHEVEYCWGFPLWNLCPVG